MSRVKILADSTCDLSPELLQKYEIDILPLNIVLDEKSYLDGAEITPDEIYRWADANQTTPKTAAPGPKQAEEFLRPYAQAGTPAVFLGISEDMSSCCQVVRLAAEALDYTGLHIINAANLSTGIGLQVLKAADLAQQGKTAEEIAEIIERDKPRVRASFVVDTLTYLYRGGRCSATAALVGNVLKLKPRIEVKDGKMGVSKKYRGVQDKVVMSYAADMEQALRSAEPARVFITHSGIDDSVVQAVREYLQSLQHFENIYVTRAGGVISSHCGYGTLGVLFYAAE